MAMQSAMEAHKSWEDWLGIALGILIIMSPSFAGETASTTVIVISAVIGILVALLSALELVQLSRWEEIIQTISGLALMASPFVFGYAGEGILQWWHIGLGAVVAILGVVELWQDRHLDESALSRARK